MTKKFLFGTLAIALAFGMMVIGCDNSDKDDFKAHTINLTPVSGENAILLTLKGASWADPSDLKIQLALLAMLDWDSKSGNIPTIALMSQDFFLKSDNVIKITFSKLSLATGSGTVKLKNSSGLQLFAVLEAVTKYMDPLGVWSIGKNNPVTITIK